MEYKPPTTKQERRSRAFTTLQNKIAALETKIAVLESDKLGMRATFQNQIKDLEAENEKVIAQLKNAEGLISRLYASNKECKEALSDALKVAEFEGHAFRTWHATARALLEDK